MKRLILLSILLSNVAFAQFPVLVGVKLDSVLDRGNPLIITGNKVTGGQFTLSAADAFFLDKRATKKGLEYAADYSANYTSRSMPDVGYITSTLSALTTSTVSEGSNLYFTNARARSAVSLTTTGTSGVASYSSSTGVLNIPQYAGTVSSVGVSSSSLNVSGSPVTGSGTITINLPPRTSVSVSRSLVTTTSSTGFQPSSTLDYQVTYSVYAQVTSALVGTNTADVFLETAATNSTTPADWTTISRSGISIQGVASTSGNTQTVSGYVPTGYFVRIRTVAAGPNAGSAVFTYQVGQENSY